ncbi:hypothetical protein [Streptomyces sp. CBMA123]|uniref:hypothetical protein n=1 Tax=Streptomyces sp. CBMA123 TaxID=1896313 RepID=UPI0016619733|nr:hypothetical protein [Streptomyces sp. CBMA123]
MTVTSPAFVVGRAADAAAAGVADLGAAAVIDHDGRVQLVRRKPEVCQWAGK